MKYIASVNGRDFTIDVDRLGEVTVDERAHAVDLRDIGGTQLFSLILDNRSYEVFAERRAGVYDVMIKGDRYTIDVEEARLRQLKAMGGQAHVEQDAGMITAPMPGLVVRVLVEAGQEVEADQGLLILEAMKMENEIRCPRAGVVRSLGVAAGQAVNLGDLLAVVESG